MRISQRKWSCGNSVVPLLTLGLVGGVPLGFGVTNGRGRPEASSFMRRWCVGLRHVTVGSPPGRWRALRYGATTHSATTHWQMTIREFGARTERSSQAQRLLLRW